MEDREWMYTGRASQGQVTNEWIGKTDAFLEQAFGVAAKGESKICCPCNKCANRKRQMKKVMGEHLWKNGFMADYTRWVYHGEDDRMCLHQNLGEGRGTRRLLELCRSRSRWSKD
jgi:hypothetical protein